ncbi:MAG: S9 family peptidase, partial [Flavobacterium stagni]
MIQLRYLLFLFVVATGWSQENLSYQKPPAEILALADYQRTPSVSMDSRKEYMLLSYRSTYKSLDDLNQEEMRLGGLRINPVTNISSTANYITNLKIRKVKATEEIQVAGLPENPKITFVSWSPDERKIAFTHTTSKGIELWVIDVATASAKKITSDNLNANLGSPYMWKDNATLL